MKIVKNSAKKKFEPNEFSLTIDSLRELEMMWAIFNASPASITSFVNDNKRKKSVQFTTEEISLIKSSNLWRTFDELLNEYQ